MRAVAAPAADAAPVLVAVDREAAPHFLATRALVQVTPDGLVLPAAAAELLGVGPGRAGRACCRWSSASRQSQPVGSHIRGRVCR